MFGQNFSDLMYFHMQYQDRVTISRFTKRRNNQHQDVLFCIESDAAHCIGFWNLLEDGGIRTMLQLRKDKLDDAFFYFLISPRAKIQTLEVEIDVHNGKKSHVLPLWFLDNRQQQQSQMRPSPQQPLPLPNEFVMSQQPNHHQLQLPQNYSHQHHQFNLPQLPPLNLPPLPIQHDLSGYNATRGQSFNVCDSRHNPMNAIHRHSPNSTDSIGTSPSPIAFSIAPSMDFLDNLSVSTFDYLGHTSINSSFLLDSQSLLD